jgi:general secretion pathway protein I
LSVVRSIDRGDAGFTIIEVLVALAIVAISIVAISSLMAGNARGVRALERHVELIQAVRALMAAGIPPRTQLRPGTSTGQAKGYRWTIDVTPLGGGWAVDSPAVPWVPELVRVRVRSATGALSDIRTVRLIPRQSE